MPAIISSAAQGRRAVCSNACRVRAPDTIRCADMRQLRVRTNRPCLFEQRFRVDVRVQVGDNELLHASIARQFRRLRRGEVRQALLPHFRREQPIRQQQIRVLREIRQPLHGIGVAGVAQRLFAVRHAVHSPRHRVTRGKNAHGKFAKLHLVVLLHVMQTESAALLHHLAHHRRFIHRRVDIQRFCRARLQAEQ